MGRVFAAWVGFDNGCRPGFGKQRPQGVAVVGGIAEDFLGRGQPRRQQPGRLRGVAVLPGRALPAQHVARAVTHYMDFARVPPPAAPDPLFAVFFSAPVPC